MSTDTSQNAGTHQGEDSSLDLLAIWRAVRKYWMTSIAVALAVTGAVAFYTLGQKKIYQASATVMFDPNPPRPLGGRIEQVVELGSGSVWDTTEYYETQYELIKSAKVAKETVLQLGLHRDPAFLQGTPAGETPLPGAPEIDPDDAADALRSRISVSPVKGSRLATVRLEDANPERAARILGALVDIYVAQNVGDARESSNDATDWLHSQLSSLKGELEDSEMDLHNYKKEKRLLSVEYADKSNMLREEMAQINEALTAVKTKRVEVAARRNELAKVKADDPLNLPASEFITNPTLSTLKGEYQEALRERDGLLGSQRGANHPDVLSATARVDLARTALLAEVRNIQGAIDRDLAVVSAQEGGLHALLEQSKKEALDLNLLEIEYNRLNRTKQNHEKLYAMVMERSKETELTREILFNNIRVVDRPRPPGGPIRPRVPMNIAAGAFLGLLLGVGAAMGRGMLDRTIKTPSDVEQTLKASFLGLIPEIDESQASPRRGKKRRGTEDSAPELIVHHDPTSGIAEAARSIRTNLMFMAPDNPYRTLLVTSAGPADGKTTVACCIAIAMAQAGRRVLLVDCDLRRPRLHRIFRKSSDVGLTSTLLEDSGDVVFASTVPNLFVTVAGPIPPNPAEILQSEKFRQHLEHLKSRFDMVILDSPPLMAVTDATILSKQVDGTVLVIRAYNTRKEVAQHGMRNLTDVGATVAGVVLNAVNLSRDEYRYSYHYYRRGEYYAHREEPQAPKPPEMPAPPPA